MELEPSTYHHTEEEIRDIMERLASNLAEAIKETEDLKTSFLDDLSKGFLDDLIETIKPSLTLIQDFEEEFENRFGSSRTSGDDSDYSLAIPRNRKQNNHPSYTNTSYTNEYFDDNGPPF